ncbi:hypothetical protein ACIGPN_17420 [Streptomyces afghaniensis]|uniref:hypothetical protein n=1 Tax=Streptomyces afghaniensis TaxID=66865 RepID=UPI0037D336C7
MKSRTWWIGPRPGKSGPSCQIDGQADAADVGARLLPWAGGEGKPGELRFLAERLTEALADALRIAESRGMRLKSLN